MERKKAKFAKRRAAAAANALVKNPPEAVVLEASYLLPRLVFLQDAMIALTGGDGEFAIKRGDDVLLILINQAISIKAGDILEGQPVKGCPVLLSFGIRFGTFAVCVSCFGLVKKVAERDNSFGSIGRVENKSFFKPGLGVR